MLHAVNLRQVANGVTETPTERRRHAGLHAKLKEFSSSIKDELDVFEEAESAEAIYGHLRSTNPSHLRDLETLSRKQAEQEGFQLVDYDNRPPLEKWLHPRRSAATDLHWRQCTLARSTDQLQSLHLSDMSHAERRSLHAYWQGQIKTEKTNILVDLFNQFRRSQHALRNCFRERDLLRRGGSKILLCEEAGEVLEARMLTALLPTIEHAILIGDHQQLRPQIQNYEL